MPPNRRTPVTEGSSPSESDLHDPVIPGPGPVDRTRATPVGPREDRALHRERYSSTHGWFWANSAVGCVVLAVYLAFAIPTYGWWPFLLIGATALAGPTALLMEREVSERAYAWAHLTWMIGVGVSAALTGGANSFLLPLLAAYTLGFFSRLRPLIGAGFALSAFGLGIAAVLVSDWAGFLDFPWLVLSSAIGMLSITMLAAQMAAGEIHQRARATIDQLTGLLNRRGLEERLAELGQQAMVIGEDIPLGVIVCDLDHFKAVNDAYGHQRGDDVLRDVAYLVRKVLRRFELVYRMGGEEFLVVLPGHDLASSAAAAESIRAAIEIGRPGGLEITMSCGVAARSLYRCEVDELLADADTAMYAAKRAGRNRVIQAGVNRPAS